MTRASPSPWDDKWNRAVHDWQTRRVKADNTVEVLDGLQPLRRGKLEPYRVELLEGGNRGRSEFLDGLAFALIPSPAELVPPNFASTPLVEISSTSNEAERVTVTLHGPDAIDPPATGIVRAIALIEMGNDGTALDRRAEVDWIRGLSFTVGGGFIRVSGANFSLTTAGPPHVGLKVGAFISRLPVGVAISSPQRTLYRDTALAPAATQDFPIPPFAKNVRIVREVFATSFDVTVGTVVGGANYSTAIAAGVDMARLPLAGDSFFIRVTNTSAGAIARLRAIFELAL